MQRRLLYFPLQAGVNVVQDVEMERLALASELFLASRIDSRVV